MAHLTSSSSSSTIKKSRRRRQQLLPCELLNELLICLPRPGQLCRFSELLSTSSVVCNLLSRNESFRRWRQNVSRRKGELIGRAKLTKQTNQPNRFEKMAQLLKKASELGGELSEEESDLLLEALENVALARYSSWEEFCEIEEKEEGQEAKKCATESRKEVEGELREVCKDMLVLMDKSMKLKASDPLAMVYYLKVKAVHYQRLFNVSDDDDERKGFLEKCERCFQEGLDIAAKNLQPANFFRLDLVLNYSEFFYNMNFPEKARQLTEEALQCAEAELDPIQTVMKKMRDNLAKWTSNSAGRGQQQDEGGMEADAPGGIDH